MRLERKSRKPIRTSVPGRRENPGRRQARKEKTRNRGQLKKSISAERRRQPGARLLTLDKRKLIAQKTRRGRVFLPVAEENAAISGGESLKPQQPVQHRAQSDVLSPPEQKAAAGGASRQSGAQLSPRPTGCLCVYTPVRLRLGRGRGGHTRRRGHGAEKAQRNWLEIRR